MNDVRIIEAAEYMEDGVSLSDVCKKLVSESFSLAGSLHESCNINYLYGCRNHSFRVAEAFEYLKSLVRYDCGADIRFYGAEREVSALCLS